ncbi:MAG: hypothetical protein LBL04_14485 [Bacteroidales bacterium]|jgi:hypothetical protein|nr:hypothetical protein [Bacteroidales bacterium]
MKNLKRLILAFAGIAAGLFPAYSQDDEDEITKLLTREVEVEDPVYMPVVGVGAGYFSFYGDVNDAYRSYTIGKPGIRVNVATFLGKRHHLRGNLVFMMGDIMGTQRSVVDTAKNLNFRSSIYSFGFNIHYSFKPWLKGKFFEPFVSVGAETLQFDSKADYYNTGYRYHYWTDGTIRDAPEDMNPNAKIIPRDYDYEKDLRSLERNELGKYSQFAIAIPVDIGVDFNISERVTLRAATSLHYTFTDLLDDLSSKSKNPDYKGKSGNDMYAFTYLSLHLDLFSSDKVKIVEDLFANIADYDYALFDDQDNDGTMDGWDQCPDTPEAVPVDTVGCPFDSDGDGVPDYLDREVSRSGAIVDEYGVEINENMVIEIFNAKAIRRSDVESYLLMHKIQNRTRRSDPLPIPDKYKNVDTNGDGYISFDELLKSINDYFDSSSGYSPGDIKELNDFFFEQ